MNPSVLPNHLIIAPILIPLVAVLLLVAFVPQLSLALPMAVGK